MTITEALVGLGELALKSESKSEPGMIPQERNGPIGHPLEVNFSKPVFERLELLELQALELFEWRRQQLFMNRLSAVLFAGFSILILILGIQVITLNRIVDSLRSIAELSK